jgi:outer membrane protein assembly factor BamB
VNTAEKGGVPLGLAWSAAVTSMTSLSPAVVANGRVAVSDVRHVYVLDAKSGSLIWSHDWSTNPSFYGAVGNPALAGDKLFVGSVNNSPGTFFWCFDAATGNSIWSAPMGAQWENYWAPIVVGNAVFTDGGEYGGLYAFDVTTGAQLWFQQGLEQYDQWSPSSYQGSIWSFTEGHLRSFDPATGAAQSKVDVTWNWMGWSMMTSPVFQNGFAYVVAPPDLYGIDLGKMAVAWTSSGFQYSGTPAIGGSSVFAINAGQLQSVDANTGTFLWSFPGDQALSSQPVIAGQTVYVASNQTVFAVDAATGKQLWSAPQGGSLSLAEHLLLVARADGTVSAFTLP